MGLVEYISFSLEMLLVNESIGGDRTAFEKIGWTRNTYNDELNKKTHKPRHAHG